MSIYQDEKAWNAGYAAGRAGLPYACPPDVADRIAWLSGYLEGKATLEEERRRALEASAPLNHSG